MIAAPACFEILREIFIGLPLLACETRLHFPFFCHAGLAFATPGARGLDGHRRQRRQTGGALLAASGALLAARPHRWRRDVGQRMLKHR